MTGICRRLGATRLIGKALSSFRVNRRRPALLLRWRSGEAEAEHSRGRVGKVEPLQAVFWILEAGPCYSSALLAPQVGVKIGPRRVRWDR